MKLIPMTDFVLEKDVKFEASDEMDYLNTRELDLVKIIKYANFLKRKLELGMFVPCDKDDVPLPQIFNVKISENEYTTSDEYKKAQKEVLFKGFEIVERMGYKLLKCGNFQLQEIDNKYFFQDEVNSKYKIIEDLCGLDLEIKKTAVKS